MLRSIALAAALVATLPPTVHAQGDGPAAPEGWRVRTDRPDQAASDVSFMDMPPGWHVTTGPAAILWHPEHTATGEFTVEMESFLFDPRGRREGFGLFVGGRDLDGPGQRYLYFLLREGGEFLVKRRAGDETETVIDWSPAPSMVSYADRPDDEATARNVMALEADDEEVRFFVNGEEVASLSRAALDVDGLVGMRINHGLNVHVSRLETEGGGAP